MRLPQSFRDLPYALWYGTWSCGLERWKGKPRFGLFHFWYDGVHYAFHLGPLWIELDN